jgi:peptidyl-tRNA hydrolase, PTH1 family
VNKTLVVGLGNPGKDYSLTRHNMGFLVVTELAERNGEKFKKDAKHQAEIATVDLGGTVVRLAKPQTFMNNSGQAVRSLVHYYDLDLDAVWIISDDIDLPFGTIRHRAKGTAGGHQGLQSIITALSNDEFHRLRIGIGSDKFKKVPAEEYVLQPFNSAEKAALPDTIESALKLLIAETND